MKNHSLFVNFAGAIYESPLRRSEEETKNDRAGGVAIPQNFRKGRKKRAAEAARFSWVITGTA